MIKTFTYLVFLGLLSYHSLVWGQSHPVLGLPAADLQEIRQNLGQVPLFDQSLAQARTEVEAAMAKGVQVPIPKDMAGGYTHEQHKQNWFILYKAGLLFQLTEEEAFAQYIHEVLKAYAEMYPGLPIHPTDRSYATGKIFWQCLNDANWLVYVSQAYDCIYDWLEEEERSFLEQKLFRPYADFLSVENPKFFDRIHNHSTWGNAAVGMIALVMEDDTLLKRALYGLKGVTLAEDAFDNDGGLIKLPGQKASGFLAQIDHAFSPDGYYTEGPYYQRYAIFPFMVFAKALSNARPDLNIFQYRDGLLVRSVYALLNQTDAAGRFFPINDAQKGMSYLSRELVTAVGISYGQNQDPSLLSIVEQQGQVLLDETGFAVAKALKEGQQQPFPRESILLRDGAAGEEGALAILRAENLSLVMKNTAQGLGHGHYDKLSFSLYDGENEIIQDYGAARWVNVDQKAGGRYLPENKTWAKQTIAHNTLTVNETSHFGGVFKVANAHHSEPYLFETETDGYQLCSAKERNAYPGMELHRTMILLEDPALVRPLVLDLLRTAGESIVQYDLPYYFQGHLLTTNFDFQIEKRPSILGQAAGYQHLWKEAGGAARAMNQMTFMEDNRFYTLHTQGLEGDSLLLVRCGANDPNFNLRRDPAMLLRRKAASSLFFTVLEAHGSYSPVTEIPLHPYPEVSSMEILHNDSQYSVVRVEMQNELSWTCFLANQHPEASHKHELTLSGKSYQWTGPTLIHKE